MKARAKKSILPVVPDFSSRLENALREYKARGVVMHLPLFLQLEPGVFAACRAIGAPLFINSPSNLPLAAAALRSGGVDTVVSEVADAAALSSYLYEKKSVRPKLWFLVRRTDTALQDVPAGLLGEGEAVVVDVHTPKGL